MEISTNSIKTLFPIQRFNEDVEYQLLLHRASLCAAYLVIGDVVLGNTIGTSLLSITALSAPSGVLAAGVSIIASSVMSLTQVNDVSNICLPIIKTLFAIPVGYGIFSLYNATPAIGLCEPFIQEIALQKAIDHHVQ